MSEVQKRLATDQTLQSTNTALGLLAKDSTLGAANTALGLLAKDTTLNSIVKNVTVEGTNGILEAIAEILVSVRSVNGKYGIVVLDSGDILIRSTDPNSKTVEEVLVELEEAVDNTPLTFTPTLISGDDYSVVVTVGSP